MKKLILAAIFVGLMVMPALASPTIEFNPAVTGGGNWWYNGAGVFSFTPLIDVTRGLGSSADTLVGAKVNIPNLSVSGLPNGPYGVTPVTSTITITNAANTVVYLTGTLHSGLVIPVGTGGILYPFVQMDITNLTVNNTIGSAALALVAVAGRLDFDLSLNGAEPDFGLMLKNGTASHDGFSGSMTAIVPVPGAILLAGIGTGLVGWLRRRRAL